MRAAVDHAHRDQHRCGPRPDGAARRARLHHQILARLDRPGVQHALDQRRELAAPHRFSERRRPLQAALAHPLREWPAGVVERLCQALAERLGAAERLPHVLPALRAQLIALPRPLQQQLQRRREFVVPLHE